MSTKLIFSFDSEDYETPAADDAEKWWAETMSRYGITACICVVGELARALRQRGRQDVICAMAKHEIAFHSDMHSAHPNWAEYLDTMSWEEGVARVLREEGKGIADVQETFGQHPVGWCKPGASWGPQVAHAMAQMDIPIFCDSPFQLSRRQPLWFDNCLCLYYGIAFDHFFETPHTERLEKMKAGFLEEYEKQKGSYLIMYTHPCRLVTSRFTRSFAGGKNTPRERWKPSPLRAAQEIQELKEDFDQFLSWVVKQPGIELTTYRGLFADYRPRAAPWLLPADLPQLADLIFSGSYGQINGTCLSPAEQFGAAVHAIAMLADRRPLSEGIPVRRLLGPTSAPPSLEAPVRLRWKEFAAAARWVDTFCSQNRALPSSIPTGSQAVGPNAFLQAAAPVIRQEGKKLPASVEVLPMEEYLAITREDHFRRLRFYDTWSEFPKDFKGLNVLEMIRLQAWTAKPVVV